MQCERSSYRRPVWTVPCRTSWPLLPSLAPSAASSVREALEALRHAAWRQGECVGSWVELALLGTGVWSRQELFLGRRWGCGQAGKVGRRRVEEALLLAFSLALADVGGCVVSALGAGGVVRAVGGQLCAQAVEDEGLVLVGVACVGAAAGD